MQLPPSFGESSFGDGYHEGEAEGVEKGIEQTTKAIASKLIQEGATIEVIAAVTGLTVAAIEDLISTEA